MLLQKTFFSSTFHTLLRRGCAAGLSTQAPVATDDKKRVVIIGGGWAGYNVLSTIDQSKYDVKIISPRNHYLFTPLLASTTVGTLSFRSIIEPLRSKNKPHRYYQASMTGLDLAQREVLCEGVLTKKQFSVSYDYLVLAPGAQNNTFGVPGVTQYACFLKELEHARIIRTKILQCFELANLPSCDPLERQRLLTFVWCGAGPTSCESAGEFADFFWSDLRKAFPHVNVHDVRIIILEASNKILPMFEQKLVGFAMEAFRREGIEVRLSSPVKEVNEQGVVLANGELIRSACIIWSTGVAPHPFISALPFERHQGRLIIDEHLNVPGHENVFALGDAAVNPQAPLPATAQVAYQQGGYLAKRFNDLAEGAAVVRPFKFRFMGIMAAIGDFKAIVDMPGAKISGWVAWFAWRSVYFTKLGSWKSRMGVPFDWLKTMIFGRDVSSF